MNRKSEGIFEKYKRLGEPEVKEEDEEIPASFPPPNDPSAVPLPPAWWPDSESWKSFYVTGGQHAYVGLERYFVDGKVVSEEEYLAEKETKREEPAGQLKSDIALYWEIWGQEMEKQRTAMLTGIQADIEQTGGLLPWPGGQLQTPVSEAKGAKDYPDICPECTSPSWNGLSKVHCSNKDCKHAE